MKNTINIILNGFMKIWNFLTKFFTSRYMISIYQPFIKYLSIITAVIILIAVITIISIKIYKLIL